VYDFIVIVALPFVVPAVIFTLFPDTSHVATASLLDLHDNSPPLFVTAIVLLDG
jgi:hypothetical protein